MKYILAKHAQDNLRERKIPLSLMESVLENPDQVVEEKGMNIYQSRLEIGDTTQLLRVIVNDRTNPVIVITVYPTSRINRYWRTTE